jgi:hypothetical protein
MNEIDGMDVGTPQKLAAFMSQSFSETDWNRRCDLVKKFFDGDYPNFWYVTCIASGLMDRTLGRGSSNIKMEIVTFPKQIKE